MAENGAFDHLVSDLGKDEKSNLLEKLRAHSVLSEEPLFDEKSDAAEDKIEAKYEALPWYTRLLYWLIAIFTGKSPVEICRNSLLTAAGRDIVSRYPGMYEPVESLLREDVKREIVSLKDAARFFYTMLDSSVNKDRGAFMSYLASLAMPAEHQSFVENTDPNFLRLSHPELADTKLRSLAVDFIETESEKISAEIHEKMYENSRMLFCLKQLSSFLFDRLIMSFNPNGESGIVCPISIVKAQLIALDNILFSIKKIPSMDLLSALFIFSMEEHKETTEFDEDKALQKFITQAEKAIAVIRMFNKHVPLTRIIRCGIRDLSWEPSEVSGGEDWFSVFKNYWIDSTRSKFNLWILERRQNELMESLNLYFKDIKMLDIQYAASNENPEGVPVDDLLALSFLLTFHKKIFMPEINTVIRPILIDGEFHKRENRAEFTESYNVLIKLDDSIKEFDESLSSAGDLGKRWGQANNEVQSVTVRKRKMHTITEEIRELSEAIVSSAHDALCSMDNVLNGIAIGSHGGKYDTLSNLPKIQGKGTQFMDALNVAIPNIHNATKILNSIKAAQSIDDLV